MSLERRIEELAREHGATAAGFAARERLPAVPSADPDFLLPGARSLVSIMVHYDAGIVADYLAKRDAEALRVHELALYRRLHDGAGAVATLLESEGHAAVAAQANLDYRYKRKPAYRWVPQGPRQALVDWLARDGRQGLGWAKRAFARSLYRGPMRVSSWRLTPSFAHRYAAVAAGLGTIGWSGNVLHPDHGARVLFNTVLTNAELAQSAMLDATLCDGCRLCASACQSGFIRTREADRVSVGGREQVHNRKASNLRCVMVCGGFSGQSRDLGWSTWCQGRVELPERDEELQACWDGLLRSSLGSRNHASVAFATMAHHAEHGFVHRDEQRFGASCGYCQYVCAPRRGERRALWEALSSAG